MLRIMAINLVHQINTRLRIGPEITNLSREFSPLFRDTGLPHLFGHDRTLLTLRDAFGLCKVRPFNRVEIVRFHANCLLVKTARRYRGITDHSSTLTGAMA